MWKDTYDAAIRKYLLDRQNISPSIGRNRAQGHPPLPTDILELSGDARKRRREQIVDEYIDGDSQVEDAAVTPSGTPLYYERSGQRQQDFLQAMVDERRKNLPMLTSKRLDKVADSKPGIQLHNAIESLGCRTCRRRKKKCDEKYPECTCNYHFLLTNYFGITNGSWFKRNESALSHLRFYPAIVI